MALITCNSFSNATDKERPSDDVLVEIGECTCEPRHHQVLTRLKDLLRPGVFRRYLTRSHVLMRLADIVGTVLEPEDDSQHRETLKSALLVADVLIWEHVKF